MQRHTWNVFSLPLCLLYTWLFEAIQFINYYHNSLQFVLSINMNQNDNMIFSKKKRAFWKVYREKAQKKISTHHWNRMGLMENIFQMVNLLLCWFSWKVRKIEYRKMWWSMKFVRNTEKKNPIVIFAHWRSSHAVQINSVGFSSSLLPIVEYLLCRWTQTHSHTKWMRAFYEHDLISTPLYC